MRSLSSKEVEDAGVVAEHTQMENGEYRYRLLSKVDGSAYVRTEVTGNGSWQKSHFHKNVKETYIIERGKVIFFEKKDNIIKNKTLLSGDIITTEPYISHNLYVFAGAIFHTVKHNSKSLDADWFPDLEMDKELLYYSIDQF